MLVSVLEREPQPFFFVERAARREKGRPEAGLIDPFFFFLLNIILWRRAQMLVEVTG